MRMNINTSARTAALLAVCSVVGCTTPYAVRDLGVGAAGTANRLGLNNSGSVVATRVVQAADPHNIFAFGLYNQGQPPQNLPYEVDNATFGLKHSWGAAVSDAGFWVGFGGGTSTGGKLLGIVMSGSAGVLPGNHVATLAPLPGFTNSEAYDINTNRTIVGICEEPGKPTAATLWPGWEGGAPVGLGEGLPTNIGNYAVALNKHTRVVGYYYEGSQPSPTTKDRAWFRDPGTATAGLPATPPSWKTLPDVAGRAHAINDSDIVVGESMPGVQSGGWVWRPSDGAFMFLPGAQTSAYALNNAGVIVGSSGGKACYWPNFAGSEPGLHYGDPIDLNGQIDRNAGISLFAAYQINTAGQIVALGSLAGHPLDTHVFLLTPR